MEKIKIDTPFIKLDSFLKLALGISGGDAKNIINEGLVKVNENIETRRGKKLYDHDKVSFEDEIFEVICL